MELILASFLFVSLFCCLQPNRLSEKEKGLALGYDHIDHVKLYLKR